MIFLKSHQEIEIMRVANRIVSEILAELRENICPGISTGEIDRISSELIRKKGARQLFKIIQEGKTPFIRMPSKFGKSSLIHEFLKKEAEKKKQKKKK